MIIMNIIIGIIIVVNMITIMIIIIIIVQCLFAGSPGLSTLFQTPSCIPTENLPHSFYWNKN